MDIKSRLEYLIRKNPDGQVLIPEESSSLIMSQSKHPGLTLGVYFFWLILAQDNYSINKQHPLSINSFAKELKEDEYAIASAKNELVEFGLIEILPKERRNG